MNPCLNEKYQLTAFIRVFLRRINKLLFFNKNEPKLSAELKHLVNELKKTFFGMQIFWNVNSKKRDKTD